MPPLVNIPAWLSPKVNLVYQETKALVATRVSSILVHKQVLLQVIKTTVNTTPLPDIKQAATQVGSLRLLSGMMRALVFQT